jgi:dienelactone hydrolase
MGLYYDAQAVYDYVRRRNDLNQEKIILFGRSLGGAIAVQLGNVKQYRCIVNCCSYCLRSVV